MNLRARAPSAPRRSQDRPTARARQGRPNIGGSAGRSGGGAVSWNERSEGRGAEVEQLRVGAGEDEPGRNPRGTPYAARTPSSHGGETQAHGPGIAPEHLRLHAGGDARAACSVVPIHQRRSRHSGPGTEPPDISIHEFRGPSRGDPPVPALRREGAAAGPRFWHCGSTFARPHLPTMLASTRTSTPSPTTGSAGSTGSWANGRGLAG